MEEVIKVITLESEENENEDQNQRQLTQKFYPFRICDSPLPQCNTGFVYMLTSIKRPSYAYVGETECLRRNLKEHNSGYNSCSTEPSYLRPFAVMAYICGFDGKKTLHQHIKQKWEDRRNELFNNGVNDIREWSRCGNDVIQNTNEASFNIERQDLRLILLFKN